MSGITSPKRKSHPGDPIALCLSGGGYRAAAFHLGALRRLNEIGILNQVEKISSVSGGSILAAHLAQSLSDLKLKRLNFSDWEGQVARPFRERILLKDIRTMPFLKQWVLPWNWFRAGPAVTALEGQYRRHLTSLRLKDLPEGVHFTFCSTDLLYGVNWIFEKNRIGDYKAGHYTSQKEMPVAKAVAASSCFPPLFTPMKMKLNHKQNTNHDLPRVVHLSDGGIYDNLGVQPVWTDNPILIVSDGGAPFSYEPGSSPLRRLKRYIAISTKQGLSLRWQWLKVRFKEKDGLKGSSWRIGRYPEKYSDAISGGYSESFSRDVIAKIRTDMNAFSFQEIGILENHGYLMADAAIRSEMFDWCPPSLPKGIAPYIDLMDEAIAEGFLRGSNKRRPLKSLINFLMRPCEPFRPRLAKKVVCGKGS